MNLRIKFILILFLAAIACGLSLGFLVTNYTKNELVEGAEGKQLELGNYAIDTVDRFLKERSDDITSLELVTAHYLNDNHEKTVNQVELENWLERVKAKSGYWVEFSLIDITGNVMVSTNNEIVKENIFSEQQPEAFLIVNKVLESGREQFSDVFIRESSGQQSMLFARPVRDVKNKELIAVLVGHISWQSVVEMLESIKGPLIHLLNKEGMVIGTNDPQHSGGIMKEYFVKSKMWEHFLVNKEMSIVGTNLHENEEVLMSYVSEVGFLDYPGNGWLMVLETPTRIALESFRQIFLEVLKILIPVVFLVAIFVMFLIEKNILIPIKEIEKFSLVISKGDFSKTIKLKNHDEIGSLTTSINNMAMTLKNFYAGLESKVVEKTKILNQKLADLESKNLELEKFKKAMMNLLEDSKILEEELKIQKKNVEIKVLERTKELEAKSKSLEEARLRATQGWLQLQAEEARLTASMEALPLGLLILDGEHNVVGCNQELRRIAAGSNDVECSLAKFEEFLRKVGLEITQTCAHCRKDKKGYRSDELVFGELYLRLISVPVVLEEKVIGSTFLVEDITESRKLQKTRDEFFSVASHELRTPLTAIRGNTQMLNDYYPEVQNNPEVKEMVGDIHEASVRLIQIVNDFLDASRLELKKVDMRLEKVNIKELLEKSMEEVNPGSVGKELEYKLAMHVDQGELVMADKARLQQVVINILGNAIKFTKHGGVYVDVESGDNQKIKVKISDTGEGISKLDSQDLFKKFKQVGANAGLSRETSQGSGMGLYISHLIMKVMGGKVYLDRSEEGKGSTFAIEIPRVTL